MPQLDHNMRPNCSALSNFVSNEGSNAVLCLQDLLRKFITAKDQRPVNTRDINSHYPSTINEHEELVTTEQYSRYTTNDAQTQQPSTNRELSSPLKASKSRPTVKLAPLNLIGHRANPPYRPLQTGFERIKSADSVLEVSPLDEENKTFFRHNSASDESHKTESRNFGSQPETPTTASSLNSPWAGEFYQESQVPDSALKEERGAEISNKGRSGSNGPSTATPRRYGSPLTAPPAGKLPEIPTKKEPGLSFFPRNTAALNYQTALSQGPPLVSTFTGSNVPEVPERSALRYQRTQPERPSSSDYVHGMGNMSLADASPFCPLDHQLDNIDLRYTPPGSDVGSVSNASRLSPLSSITAYRLPLLASTTTSPEESVPRNAAAESRNVGADLTSDPLRPPIIPIQSNDTPRSLGLETSGISLPLPATMSQQDTGLVEIIPPTPDQRYLPCEGNKYAGFCKSGWRGQIGGHTKTFKMRTVPYGKYTSRMRIARCCKCSFDVRANAYSKEDHIKKVFVMDGLQYTWNFLFKCHIKEQPSALDDTSNKAQQYGCIFCCGAGIGTPVYKNKETFLRHIQAAHVKTLPKLQHFNEHVVAILGRHPLKGEKFDIVLGAPQGGT